MSSELESDVAIAKRPGKRRWHLKLIVLSVALLISLFAAEIALRLTGRFPPPPTTFECLDPDLYEADEDIGYRLIPSRTVTHKYPRRKNPRELTIVSNRHGFRLQREFDEPDDRQRVLVIGDSFVFGLGVEHEERFTNVVEQLRPAWRVDNLGLPGWGADLMLKAFQSIGPAAKPDVVVVCLYTDDFVRVRPFYTGVGFPIPRYKLDGDRLTPISYPKRRLVDALHLTQAISKVRWTYTSIEWNLNEAILDAIHDQAQELDSQLLLVFLPGHFDTDNDQKRRFWLCDYAADRGLPYADLTDSVHAHPIEDLFIKDNFHLNATGNRLVAEELASFLDQQVANSP